MWLFISRRLRTWLVLAIAVPLARRVLRAVAARSASRNPGSSVARTLGRADSALASVSRRGTRKQRA